MKAIIAQYNTTGIVFATRMDENKMRDAIIKELTSLVHQRKHWLLSKYSHKYSIQEAFVQLDAFCNNFKSSSLMAVCCQIKRLEGKFMLIMPSPTGKHSCRHSNFQFIIKLCHAVTNRSIGLPGQR